MRVYCYRRCAKAEKNNESISALHFWKSVALHLCYDTVEWRSKGLQCWSEEMKRHLFLMYIWAVHSVYLDGWWTKQSEQTNDWMDCDRFSFFSLLFVASSAAERFGRTQLEDETFGRNIFPGIRLLSTEQLSTKYFRMQVNRRNKLPSIYFLMSHELRSRRKKPTHFFLPFCVSILLFNSNTYFSLEIGDVQR